MIDELSAKIAFMINQGTTQARPVFQTSFYSKVYLCFGLAVAMSALGTYMGLTYLAQYFFASPVVSYVLFAVELILILTSRMWSQRQPINYLLFAAFAFITGVTLVPIIAYLTLSAGGIALLVKALLATALMFGATAAFGATTRYNLQGLRGFLIMSLIGMIIVSIVGIFLPWGNTFEMIFSGFGVVLFSGYIMYDIQKLKNYPESMYIDAALQLYLDIFNLFIYILRLMSAFNRR